MLSGSADYRVLSAGDPVGSTPLYFFFATLTFARLARRDFLRADG